MCTQSACNWSNRICDLGKSKSKDRCLYFVLRLKCIVCNKIRTIKSLLHYWLIVCTFLSTIVIVVYVAMPIYFLPWYSTVEEMQASPEYSTAEEKQMESTFNERRRWVTTEPNITVTDVFEKFPLFMRNPIEVNMLYREFLPEYTQFSIK